MKTVLAGIACIVAVSWIYLLSGAGMPTMDMGGAKVMVMPPPSKARRRSPKLHRGSMRT